MNTYMQTILLNYGLYFIPLILGMLASFWVRSTYNKYSQIKASSGFTGQEVAQRILDRHNIHDIRIGQTGQGQLTDHFNPMTKEVNLSPEVYQLNSIASIAISAHELGHVLQYHTQMALMGLRTRLLPLTITLGSIWYVPFMMSIFMNNRSSDILFQISIAMFSFVLLFHLITLPIEIDASMRGLRELTAMGLLNDPIDRKGARIMLIAAASTYLAAFLGSIGQLLRLFLIRGQRQDHS